MIDPFPSEAGEAELKAILARRTTWYSALRQGLQLSLRSAGVGVPVSLAYGIVSGVVGYQIMQWTIGLQEATPAMLQLYLQVAMVVAGFTVLYAAVQTGKRSTASLTSWAPALLALPSSAVALSVYLVQSGSAKQIGPVVLQFTLLAWGLVWMSFGGAIAAIAWVRAGQQAADGQPVAVGSILEEVQRRWLEVAAPHGARVTAVTVGIQFILPGIFYALQLAFVDMVAVLDPERSALRRAGQLTRGMRGRLFRLLLVWSVVSYLVVFGVTLPLEGVRDMDGVIEKTQELFLDPSSSSFGGYVVSEVLWALSTWVSTLALLVLYLEREGQVKARAALKRFQPPVDAGPYQAPDTLHVPSKGAPVVQ